LKEEVEMEGDKKGREVEGLGEEEEEYARPSKDSWCAELEACFREAAGHGGRGWGCQGRWNGEEKGGDKCECTANTNLAVRKLVAHRWARVQRQLQHERERVRKAEVMQQKMREKKLLLARIQNGEMSLSDILLVPGTEPSQEPERVTNDVGERGEKKERVGLWSDLEQVRQTCSEAQQLCSAILGSSATAAYGGLAQTDVYPHRSLLLELTAQKCFCFV
jgi:hypothetical protein